MHPPQVPLRADRFDVLHAARDLFQRRLGDILRQCVPGVTTAIEGFQREVGNAYDQLASSSAVDDFDQTRDLTASRLTLMGEEDLELDIRIGEIGARLREAGGRDLGRTRLRYMTLLRRPTMNDAANPVGPEAICPGLWAICRQGGGKLEQTLALLERIEQGLRPQIAVLYREIDELLARHGIEPAQRSSPPLTAGAEQAGGGQVSADPLSALQQRMRQRLDAAQPATPGGFPGDAGAPSGDPAIDAAAMVMLKHLFDRLATLEARSGSASPADTPPTLPLCTLKSEDLDLPPGKPEAIALDTLSLIFEGIFDSADLPDTIKAAMARLQIPLFKLALIDQTLFADDRHPARRLINRMARAAIGLPQDSGSEHPVCRQISRLTSAVRDTLAQQGAALDPQLAELDALIAERDQAIHLAAEKHIQLLIEHENREYATQVAGTWLRASLSRTSSPPIAAFLEKYWLQVMIAAASDGGTHGLRWQQDSSTGDQLIWSVLPKETAEERKRLAGMASSLITRIGIGLDQIGVSVEERSPFLNTLFDLQTAALRSRAAAPAALSETFSGDSLQAPAASPATSSGPLVLELDGRRVLCLPMPTDARSSHRASPADWQAGDWLRFSVPERGQHCGLCCWQSQGSGRVLFFNPAWGYAIAMHRASLEQQLRSGGAQIVSRIAAFDAAAERALRRLDPR